MPPAAAAPGAHRFINRNKSRRESADALFDERLRLTIDGFEQLDREEVRQAAQGGKLTDLPRRLQLQAACRRRAVEQLRFLVERWATLKPRSGERIWIRKKATALMTCAQQLVYQVNEEHDFARLTAGMFCRQDKLCDFCARLRSARLVRAKRNRALAVLERSPDTKVVHVVMTVRNGPDLTERFTLLHRSLSTLIKRRMDYSRGRVRRTVLGDCRGGTTSIEIKRGTNSGGWHPHAHAALIVPATVDVAELQQDLRDEWQGVTADGSWNCFAGDVKTKPGEQLSDALAGTFAEVFKYATKASSMTPADSYEAAAILGGRRLVRSFGWMYGDGADDEPAELGDVAGAVDFELMDVVYRWTLDGYVQEPRGEPGAGRW